MVRKPSALAGIFDDEAKAPAPEPVIEPLRHARRNQCPRRGARGGRPMLQQRGPAAAIQARSRS